MPADIAGIGSSEQKLRSTPGFDPLKAGLGPEEYFVLTRIDGVQTARQILLATGLPTERGVAILTRLRAIGAIMLPTEAGPPPAAKAPTLPPGQPRPPAPRTMTPTRPPDPSNPSMRMPRAPTQPAQPGTPAVARAATPGATGRVPTPGVAPVAVPVPVVRAPIGSAQATAAAANAAAASAASAANAVASALLDDRYDLRIPNATREEMNALTEEVDLDDRERRLVLALRRLVEKNDPHALLGVSGDADAKAIKRGYFKLSKEVHPDRYFGKRLGSFKDRLAFVFEAVTRAHTRLSSADSQRVAQGGARKAEEPQTPGEYAGEVFDRACACEVSGDLVGAGKLFAAAVRIDPQTRYLRRAASCALAANEPRTAVEYAKKAQTQAPYDPSSARLLASAFRAAGKLNDAEEVLVMAMALKSENDVLTTELRYDLAEVRRLLAG